METKLICRCMGHENYRWFCDRCVRLPRTPAEEDGEQWHNPTGRAKKCKMFEPAEVSHES